MPTRPAPRDPRQPFGQPSQPANPPSGRPIAPRQPPLQQPSPQGGHPIDQFAPPPRRNRWWIPLLALLVLALLGWGAVRLNRAAPSETEATPSSGTAPNASAVPSKAAPTTISSAVASSVPFTNELDGSEGTFTIVDHSWTGDGLLLKVQVRLEQGSQKLGFFALDNQTTHEFNPVAQGTDDLQDQHAVNGQTLTGSVYFRKPKGDTTVFLTATNGRQVAALVVRG